MVCFSTTLIVSPQINCQFLHINCPSQHQQPDHCINSRSPHINCRSLHHKSFFTSTVSPRINIINSWFTHINSHFPHLQSVSPHHQSDFHNLWLFPPNIVDFSIWSPLIKVSPPTSMVIFPTSTVGLSASTVGLPTSTVGLPTSPVSFPRWRRIVATCTI